MKMWIVQSLVSLLVAASGTRYPNSASMRSAERWLGLLDEARFGEAAGVPAGTKDPAKATIIKTLAETRNGLGKLKSRDRFFEQIMGVSPTDASHATEVRLDTLSEFDGNATASYLETIDLEEGPNDSWSVTNYKIRQHTRTVADTMRRVDELRAISLDGAALGLKMLPDDAKVDMSIGGRRLAIKTTAGSFVVTVSDDRMKVLLLANDKLVDEIVPGPTPKSAVGRKGAIPNLATYVRAKVSATLNAPATPR